MLALTVPPGTNQAEGDGADRCGGRPVGGGAEPHFLGIDGPRYRQRSDARAEQDRANQLGLLRPLAAQRYGHDQGKDQFRGEQRLGDRQRKVADRPGGQDLACHHDGDASQPAALM